MRDGTHLYDPVARSWSMNDKFAAPFYVSKYTTYLCATPHGMVALTRVARGNFEMGLFLLKRGRVWHRLPIQGDDLPRTLTDGSTITYDSRRDQLIMTTTRPGKEVKACGQVWTYNFATNRVAEMNPRGSDSIQAARFAREAIYLPEQDRVMFGYHLNRPNSIPFYHVASNRWQTATIPGSEFFLRKSNSQGTSVDLGLVYDAKRKLVWGVMCKLTGKGALNVLRLDQALDFAPLK